MTVEELIEQLQEMDRDAEVRIATQPNWPFENSIESVQQVTGDITEIHDEDEGYREGWKEFDQPIVYIGEGQQLGYLPQGAAQQFGWK